MKRRRDRKTARRARLDPNQLGLFESIAAAPAPHAAASRSPARAAPVRAARNTAPHDRAAVLTPREAAAYLGVSVSTLKAWRASAIGPPHTMLGARMVGYRVALIDAWLAARTVGG